METRERLQNGMKAPPKTATSKSSKFGGRT